MADIKCPMCGKANPEGSEECAFCAARLTPLRPTPPPEETAVPEENLPDWLNGMRDDSTPAEPDAAANEGDLPDWLTRIRQQNQADKSEENADWLEELSGSPAEPQAEPGGWLDALRAAPDDETPAGEPAAETPAQPAEESPDWLSELPGWQPPVEETGPASEPAQSSDLSWMDRFSGSEPAPAASDEAASQNLSADDLPDWMSAFSTPAETPAPSPEESPAADQPPEWLSAVSTPLDSSPAEEVQPPAEPAAQDGPPDWLSVFSTDAEAATGAESEPEPAAPAVALPDWLSAFSVPPEIPTSSIEPSASAETPPPAENDWLSNLPSNPTNEREYSTSELRDWSSGSEDELPDALSSLPEDGTSGSGDTPNWMSMFGFAPQPAAESSQPDDMGEPENPLPVSPFVGDELPNWDSAAEDNSPLMEEQPSEEAPTEKIESAQLPGWLEAMRPLEAVIPQATPLAETEDMLEKAGPLAGILGVLPGEQLVTRKPPAYSTRLQVSDRQRTQADLIEEMLSEEVKPRTARPERSRTPQLVVRWLVALVLLLVVTLPLIAGTQILPPPNLYPPETVAFHTLVEALPQNAPVLMAVDYEPGFSAEMQLAASSVVDHLAARQARLAVMSTVPTGPVLAGSLLQSGVPDQAAYWLAPEHSVNMGYLPGGTAGLQEFASRPVVALRYTLDGKSAWEQPAVQGVNSLSGFRLVIVATESAETARAWIEQVQPALGKTPLLFVVSAQSAPFIQPYLDSLQVQGMLSGMSGGIIYARISQQPAAGQHYWDSYQFGLFFAVLLVLLGALWQLLGRLFARKTTRKGATRQ